MMFTVDNRWFELLKGLSATVFYTEKEGEVIMYLPRETHLLKTVYVIGDPSSMSDEERTNYLLWRDNYLGTAIPVIEAREGSVTIKVSER